MTQELSKQALTETALRVPCGHTAATHLRLLARRIMPPRCHNRLAFIADSGGSTRMTLNRLPQWNCPHLGPL